MWNLYERTFWASPTLFTELKNLDPLSRYCPSTVAKMAVFYKRIFKCNFPDSLDFLISGAKLLNFSHVFTLFRPFSGKLAVDMIFDRGKRGKMSSKLTKSEHFLKVLHIMHLPPIFICRPMWWWNMTYRVKLLVLPRPLASLAHIAIFVQTCWLREAISRQRIKIFQFCKKFRNFHNPYFETWRNEKK